MLLITKDRFGEPTMLLKKSELVVLCQDVYENKRVDLSEEAKSARLLRCESWRSSLGPTDYADTICHSPTDGGIRISASLLHNAVPYVSPQVSASRVAIGKLSR